MGDVKNRGSKERPQWYCRYIDVDGKRKHRPTHQQTKALAMRFVAEVEARVARGLVGIPDATSPERQGRALTLLALAERFMHEANPPTKNPERYRQWFRYTMAKHVLPELGMLPVAVVKAGQVEAFRDRKLAAGYKPATVNAMLKAISVLYIWARKQGIFDGANPTSGLRKSQPAGLMDYLSSDEVNKLLTHTREHAPTVFPMIAAAIYTGMRKGELFGLRWIDVLFDRSLIHVAHSYGKTPKSGKWRPVPLHPALAPILRDWQRVCPPGALVFPVVPERGQQLRMGTPDDMMGLEDLLRAAGCHVPIRPWHAMRHTFASHYVMSGGNLLALQKILGHSKFEMTAIYSHLAPDYMAGEMARLTFGAAPVDARRERSHAATGGIATRATAGLTALQRRGSLRDTHGDAAKDRLGRRRAGAGAASAELGGVWPGTEPHADRHAPHCIGHRHAGTGRWRHGPARRPAGEVGVAA